MDEEADTDAVRLLEILESNGLKQMLPLPLTSAGMPLILLLQDCLTSLIFAAHGPFIYFLTTC